MRFRLSMMIAGRFLALSAALLLSVPSGTAQDVKDPRARSKRVTHAQRQAAADRAKAGGFSRNAIRPAAAPGEAPRYFSHPNYANSPLPAITKDSVTGEITGVTGGLRKFVDGLPGLGAENANNLGQFIPVAVPDTTSYPDGDFYQIGLVQYREQMHSDLPPTLLRGYVQLTDCANPGAVPLANVSLDPASEPTPTGYCGVTAPHYLGAAIVAQKNRPVRILFRNLLPTGIGGNLFVPVDTTVMGAGPGPDAGWDPETGEMTEPNPQKPACDSAAGQLKPAECFSENRAVIHLHGGITPWISDGTPHQWVTPAGEITVYPEGASVENVPDMSDLCAEATDGCTTLYYTNQQSSRLLFYHDHAWGITRLNVYAGEAAPYVIHDETEQSLLDRGLIPPAADTLALVVQDKTFVPPTPQLLAQDETWDTSRWGGEGNLWVPHVYSPAQNPGDGGGVNQFGRWAYGPWFWPPTASVKSGPVANPYYDPACDPDVQWCEPPLMPGTPFNSMGMESFNDTPLVNGTAYPAVTLEPKTYRLRFLNAANDRFVNLSLYQAVDANGNPCDENLNPTPAAEASGVACTEVALNPNEVAAALIDPAGGFPTPVVGAEGPNWIQIANESGFLPAPVVIPAQPTTWVTDPTVFNAGNVDQHSLLLAPAERADVIVDFSAFAGKTLILYNDAPAAFPARDPRYDYYTGNPDLQDTGGAPSTVAGYGPNTRTVMQIKIANNAPAAAFDLTSLEAAFAHQPDGSGVFESGQLPIIVGQGAYNSAYGTDFKSNGPDAGLVQIHDTQLSFKTLSGGGNTGPSMTITFKPKMIQDEMGEAFDPEYGRMSGFLGVETPNAQAGMQNMILHSFAFPNAEVLRGVEVDGTPYSLNVTPIASTDNGTQIWKITHNGVDTHPIHFHLYEIQLLNRVGWDGIVRRPDPNELGWKETVRISPLEDTTIALRPIIPHLPFDLPNSVRLLNPAMPEGAYIENSTLKRDMGLPITAFNPDGEPIDVINHYVNFGWEYVWHCHILSHEEMDMMHSQTVAVTPKAPTNLILDVSGNTASLTWTDNSATETSFVVQRASDPAFTTDSVEFEVPANNTQYQDENLDSNATYHYRVLARNLVGDTWDYSAPMNRIPEGGGFPTMAADSVPSNVVTKEAPNSTADILWHDSSTGDINVWHMNGAVFAGESYVATVLDDGWFIVGTADFNNDGSKDILWRHTGTGFLYVWYMNGLSVAGGNWLPSVPELDWAIAGLADFNNDGSTDILWRYALTGSMYIWYMDGIAYSSTEYVDTVGIEWAITGLADFNNDGSIDILWRHTGIGSMYIWIMDGIVHSSTEYVSIVGVDWAIVALADFNDDGNMDILWRHTGTGDIYIWYMAGTAYSDLDYVATDGNMNRQIAGTLKE